VLWFEPTLRGFPSRPYVPIQMRQRRCAPEPAAVTAWGNVAMAALTGRHRRFGNGVKSDPQTQWVD
jgi:hypothetical protein